MGGGTADVMCNNIHALCKCLCAPLLCVCTLVLRASLLALINNSPVLLVRLPSSLHPLPHLPPLSSLSPLTSSPLCPSSKQIPKTYTIAILFIFSYSVPHSPPLYYNVPSLNRSLSYLLSFLQFILQVYGPGFIIGTYPKIISVFASEKAGGWKCIRRDDVVGCFGCSRPLVDGSLTALWQSSHGRI